MGIGVLLMGLGVLPAAAAPCQVPSSAYPTIQKAVSDATCATINVAAGTYNENLITISRAVTIRGEDQATTIVDAGGVGPVFLIDSGPVTIKNVTIQNGFTRAYIGGGGILNSGTLTVQNSTIADNTAYVRAGVVSSTMARSPSRTAPLLAIRRSTSGAASSTLAR